MLIGKLYIVDHQYLRRMEGDLRRLGIGNNDRGPVVCMLYINLELEVLTPLSELQTGGSTQRCFSVRVAWIPLLATGNVCPTHLSHSWATHVHPYIPRLR